MSGNSEQKQSWAEAVIECVSDSAERERLIRMYDYDELVKACLALGTLALSAKYEAARNKQLEEQLSASRSESAPMLPELCKALGWQGGTIHQAVEQTARMRAALQEITRGAGPFSRDPLKHADNCIEAMKAIATGALEGDWNPEQ
jgi:hypothetical protein